ncbi:MAG: hypothetical protein FE78DRAFT_103949 [Acidomyces sp. 'richmondensis']|nr:MAG: hypothetical protein FE78DRAFT_103949 [Acidomyces sp. 'richmondensis']
MPFRILVVGGGIAGLSAAIALRAPGKDITIFEQSCLLSEIVAAISLQPNASRILRQNWNLDGDLEQANGMIDRGFRIYDTDGTITNTVPLLSKTEYDGDRIMYHRQDLHESLKAAAITAGRGSQSAKVRTSSRVVRCDCEAGVITLESGEDIHADLIVGADGIHSILRDFVLGQKAKPVPTVGLVPDEKMNEDPDSKQSWVSKGDLTKMLETYRGFPRWVKSILFLASEVGLWQLRDMDPLPTMLPTQGQGASQAVEDAEALGAFFGDMSQKPSLEQIKQGLREVFERRYSRASLIQRYSREAARPATAKGSKEVKLRADEFMD